MRRRMVSTLTALTLALTLALGAIAITPDEVSAAPDNVAQLCQGGGRTALGAFLSSLTGGPVEVSQGACVAFFRAENPTPLIVDFCRTDEAKALFSRFTGREITTIGQCLQAVRAFQQG